LFAVAALLISLAMRKDASPAFSAGPMSPTIAG
jgi:hypothetical protein